MFSLDIWISNILNFVLTLSPFVTFQVKTEYFSVIRKKYFTCKTLIHSYSWILLLNVRSVDPPPKLMGLVLKNMAYETLAVFF